MGHQEHFLERTLRLEDSALENALAIYREKAARDWLRWLAARDGKPLEQRIAVPLGPGPSPACLILDTDGEVVTCLDPEMTLAPGPRLPWPDVQEVLARLPSLRGGDPDPRWPWKRLWRELHQAGGWLSRDAYEVLLRERLMLSALLPKLLADSVVELLELWRELRVAFRRTPERQRPEVRAAGERRLWVVRHLIHLAGDAGVTQVEGHLVRLADFPFGHIDLAAGVALGRFSPLTFDRLRAKLLAAKTVDARAGTVRAMALVAARQPSVAVAYGREVRRILERPKEDEDGAPFLRRAATIGLLYLASHRGRVGAESVAAALGRSSAETVAAWAGFFDEGCREMHERWPKAAWRPADLYLPWEEAEERRREGPRPCPEPLHEPGPGRLRRTGPKLGRNDPCPCGSGKKAKRCCGVRAEYVEDEAGASDLPPPWDAEERAASLFAERFGDPWAPRAARRTRS